jgi:ubiquinone biosynthesis protein UbiJ
VSPTELAQILAGLAGVRESLARLATRVEALEAGR